VRLKRRCKNKVTVGEKCWVHTKHSTPSCGTKRVRKTIPYPQKVPEDKYVFMYNRETGDTIAEDSFFANYTLDDIARMAGVSLKSVQDHKSGKSVPTGKAIGKLGDLSDLEARLVEDED
jgi:hypothetical protein